MSNDHGSSIGSTPLLEDLEAEQQQSKQNKSALIVEPQQGEMSKDSFALKLEETLRETERAVLSLDAVARDEFQSKSWEKARRIVEGFAPVPWFIWRLSNYVFGRSDTVTELPEGLVFGLRRLLFASASDPAIGTGQKVNEVRKALKILSPDVIAAVAVIHAVCRKLAGKSFERIWRPILDDALLRARIGYLVGLQSGQFGPGRGMLAGFAGRCGLAILISSGDLEQARQTLERLATGAMIKQVGLSVYRTDPLQVSAMTLSASGCGRAAAYGTVSYASEEPFSVIEDDEQLRWFAAFSLCEAVRMSHIEQVDQRIWHAMNFKDDPHKVALAEEAKKLVRRGHGWGWLL